MGEQNAGDMANLSLQEQEMLKYLEDLQASNPAEYELLVQQVQEGKMGKGGSGKAGPKAEEVTPSPGFVAKTRSATNQGAKVFINICQSEHVDKPAPVPVASGENPEEVQMRIPLSLGPPREDLDKSGEVCTVYDVVFHPDAVEGSLKDEEFRSFVMQLTLHQIQQKHKDELSQDITFPKVKGNYKGIAPLPQYMRKKGTPPPPPPGQEPEASEASEAEGEQGGEQGGAVNKPLVEEMAEPAVETLPAPSYAVEQRHLRGDVESSAEPDGLSVKAHLPGVVDASAIELHVNQETLELVVPSICALSLQLPVQVSVPPVSVRFEQQRRILSVLFRTDAANALEGAVHETAASKAGRGNGEASGAAEGSGEGSEDWEARLLRESESRQNARRRRAAGNAQLKRKKAADDAAAAQPEPEATAGEPSDVQAATSGEEEKGGAVSEGASEGASEGDSKDGGDAAPAASSSESSALAGLSNSIMFELED